MGVRSMDYSEVKVLAWDTGKSRAPFADQLSSACLSPSRWFREHLRGTKEQAAEISRDPQPEPQRCVSTAPYTG